MKKFTLVFSALCLSLAINLSAQPDEPFARFPAISPDGSTIAFSYQGDIWSVPAEGGRAWRMTVHEAYDTRPKWSPEGEQIAFISDRHGNDDVFVMNRNGSQIKRLTYHSTNDELTGWAAKDSILFTTNRVFNQVEWEPEIHTVAAEGGTPDRFFDSFGMMATISPDGRYLVFVKGSNGEYRQDYRGPASKDIWVYDRDNDSYTQLTDFEGNDMYPTFAGSNSLYFISDRNGTYNIYKISFTKNGNLGSTPQRITNLEKDGVRYFDISDDQNMIAFERKTGLYTLESGNSTPQQLHLEVSQDERFYNIEQESFSENAEEFSLSPSGNWLAYVIEGEIFIKHNDPGKQRSVKVTDHPYRDRDIDFLDDSSLIFSSDREGQYDLYTIESAHEEKNNLFESLKFNVNRLTSTEDSDLNPTVSPDGEKIAFNRGRGQLIVAEIDGTSLGKGITLRDTGWAEASDVAWSPDSEWLAYSMPDLNFNHEIYIQSADNSTDPENISKHPRSDTDPVWSSDGGKLAFISNRNNGDNDIWFAWLNKRDWERKQLEWDKSETPEIVSPEDTVNMNVEFDGLYKRLQQVTSMPGDESDIAISEDGQTFYFVGDGADEDLYKVEWDGSELKSLTEGGINPYSVRSGPEFKALYFMQSGGKMGRFSLDNNRLQNLPFAAKMRINHKERREQIFEETWRQLNVNFYDPNFHGQNWEQLRDYYKPWALHTSSDRDFEDVMNMMLGELNSSHMGFYGSERADTQEIQTGLLGVEVEDITNGVRIERVIPESPADRDMSKLNPGDIITAVDQQAVNEADNFYSLLADKVETPTLLEVQNKKGESRDVIIEPTGSLNDQLYNQWVEKRKELTEEYSEGRLGYVHVEGMNWPSFERFERELIASGEGKEGLVIDVRYNGGGWTTDYLLTVLQYQQHAYTVPRGATDNLQENKTEFRNHYPYGERLPLSSWTKNAVTLANQNSYSNAEIFSHAFKNLDLGTLIGEPTFGAVISTGGTGLMGGSYVRLPFRGWFVKATDENMELGPAVPDIEMINPPNYRSQEDAQLKKAVEELLQQIE